MVNLVRMRRMTKSRGVWTLSIAFFVALLGCSSGGRIVIGSKNFTEQIILGELLAQHIETQTDLTVDRRLNLGGTFVCHAGLIAGQLDIYVEYTGTALVAILKEPLSNDREFVLTEVSERYADQFDVEWSEPLGFNNTFAIIVRADTARALDIKTISAAVMYARNWKAGFGYEFFEREDGFSGLAATYNLHFSELPRVMDLGLTYRALADGEVDLIAGNSTDGLIDSLDLVTLEDDRGFFPPYDAVPIIRSEILKAYPEVRNALSLLKGTITEDDMRRMNYRVDGKRESVQVVVSDFRKEKGLKHVNR